MRLPALLTVLFCEVVVAIGQVSKTNIGTPDNPQDFYTSPTLPSFGIASSQFPPPLFRKQVNRDTVLELCNHTISHFDESPLYDAVGYFVTQRPPVILGERCNGVDHRIVVRQFIPTETSRDRVSQMLNVEASAAAVIVEDLFRSVLFPLTEKEEAWIIGYAGPEGWDRKVGIIMVERDLVAEDGGLVGPCGIHASPREGAVE
ncbi:MAG: hypothetical protein Q9183_003317 [Haloplaca sp. 2 TL-2023]